MKNSEKNTALTTAQLDKLEQHLYEISKENRIHCSTALAIAKSLGIPAGEVGKAANRLKIKISKCQLGCF